MKKLVWLMTVLLSFVFAAPMFAEETAADKKPAAEKKADKKADKKGKKEEKKEETK